MPNKTPDKTIERAFVLSVLSFPQRVEEISHQVKPNYIEDQDLRDIYLSVLAGEPISLTRELSERINISSQEVERNFATHNYKPEAVGMKVKDRYLTRLMGGRLDKIKNDLSSVTSEITLKRLQELASEVLSETPEERSPEIKDVLQRLRETQNLVKNNVGEFKVGVEILDDIIYGLFPSHIWVIAGDTGAGKSLFSLYIVEKLISNDKSVIIYSTENSAEETLSRIIGLRTSVPFIKIMTGDLDKEEEEKVEKETARLLDQNLKIYDTVYDAIAMAHKTKLHKLRDGCDVVLVDYIQNVSATPTDKGDNFFQLMRTNSRIFQRMANELQVSTILVSQVARHESAKKAEDRRGGKGAGDIAEIANVGMWLEKDGSKLEVYLNKVRHGETGKISFDFFDPLSDNIFDVPQNS